MLSMQQTRQILPYRLSIKHHVSFPLSGAPRQGDCVAADHPGPLMAAALVLVLVRAVIQGALGPDALHIVHRKVDPHRSKLGPHCCLEVSVSVYSQHPTDNLGIIFIPKVVTKIKSNEILMRVTLLFLPYRFTIQKHISLNTAAATN